MTAATEDGGLRGRLEELLDELRASLHDCVDGLTEQEARASLVPSRTTLLGLLKHVSFVEAYWFGHAVDGRALADLGVASTPGRSWTLGRADTIASVQQRQREVAAASRDALAALDLHDEVTGLGSRTVWQLYVQVLRELAQHAGHADILREQVLAARRA